MEKDKVLTERREKKERVRKQEYVKKKLKKQVGFYAKKRRLRQLFFYDILMILLMHKEAYINTNEFDPYIPSICVFLLQNCEDIFPNKITSGLPPTRGTKHLKFQAKLNRQHAKWVKFIEMFSYMRKYKQDK